MVNKGLICYQGPQPQRLKTSNAVDEDYVRLQNDRKFNALLFRMKQCLYWRLLVLRLFYLIALYWHCNIGPFRSRHSKRPLSGFLFKLNPALKKVHLLGNRLSAANQSQIEDFQEYIASKQVLSQRQHIAKSLRQDAVYGLRFFKSPGTGAKPEQLPLFVNTGVSAKAGNFKRLQDENCL